jgi:hypothetical protein
MTKTTRDQIRFAATCFQQTVHASDVVTGVNLKIDAQSIGRGKDFCFGHVLGRMSGPDLVVRIDLDSTKPVNISLPALAPNQRN